MNLLELKKDIPYKWRVQSTTKYNATCVAFVDARDVMDLLDEVVGVENWKDDYKEVGGNTYCTLSIKVGDEWISKTDCGTESNVEKEKGQASDAFKRAAVKFGIGRFLYSLPVKRLKPTKENNRGKFELVDKNGGKIYNISEYIRTGKNASIDVAIESLLSCQTVNELKQVFTKFSGYKTEPAFMAVGKLVQQRIVK